MKYAPTYFHYHIVMRDFNGALLINEPESDALYDMHRAIRHRDELEMAVAYHKFVCAMDRSTPEMRAVLYDLVVYIRGIGSDAEYESFIYDLDSQGPVGQPMWRMSYRALHIVRDLAINRRRRIRDNQTEREHDLRMAKKTVEQGYTLREKAEVLSHEELVAYSRWADEMCREALHNGVLFPMQGEAIITKRGDKFTFLQRQEKHLVLKQFAVQYRDNLRITKDYNSALEARRCDMLCSIFDHIYRDPLAAPIVASIRDGYRPDNLFQLPLHALSEIKKRLENKEYHMDIAADAPATPQAGEPYSLDRYSRDIRAAYEQAEERAKALADELNGAIAGADRNAKVAGLEGIVLAGIRNAIASDHMVRSLTAAFGK